VDDPYKNSTSSVYVPMFMPQKHVWSITSFYFVCVYLRKKKNKCVLEGDNVRDMGTWMQLFENTAGNIHKQLQQIPSGLLHSSSQFPYTQTL
jgi:hypothetical protein